MRFHWASLGVAGIAILGTSVNAALASDDRSIQPYIDEVREEAGEKSKGSYIQSQRDLLEAPSAEDSEKNYIEYLKENEIDPMPSSGSASFLEQERAKLGTKERGGAIEAYQRGRSELQMKREGRITGGLGFKYGLALTRSFSASADVQLRAFNDVYGGRYAPDFSFYYEYLPLHIEWLASIGLIGGAGLSFYRGLGKFKFPPINPVNGKPFDEETSTEFRFLTVPTLVGGTFHLNVFRYVKPYVVVGPSLIGYYESRNDGKSGTWGNSSSLHTAGGVSFLMDWLTPESSWNYYYDYSVKHTYFTVEGVKLTTLYGDVDFNLTGIYAGITFEF